MTPSPTAPILKQVLNSQPQLDLVFQALSDPTRRAIVERLNAAIREALRDPALVEALRGLGAQPVASTPEEFARHIQASTDKWALVVQSSGAKVD